MDIGSPVRNAKSLKLGSEQNSDEGKSEICCLPDTILHQILSFLPTKDAVRSSVLSRRWQFLWMSITNLEFKEESKEGAARTDFMKFVERANVEAVYISSSMLEELQMFEYITDDIDPPGCQFIISGMRLKRFGYLGELKYDYCITNTPSLVTAGVNVAESVVIKEQGRDRLAAYRTHKLVRGLANANSLKDLTISYDTLDVLTYAEELAAHLPLFDNLKHLDLFGEPMGFACRGLLNILHKSPHLESLQFSKGLSLSARGEEDGRIFNPVPACFLTHLKTVKFAHFNATEEELRVVKSLLKTARVLEKLWLNCNEEKRSNLLSILPEGSVNCDVAFY